MARRPASESSSTVYPGGGSPLSPCVHEQCRRVEPWYAATSDEIDRTAWPVAVEHVHPSSRRRSVSVEPHDPIDGCRHIVEERIERRPCAGASSAHDKPTVTIHAAGCRCLSVSSALSASERDSKPKWPSRSMPSTTTVAAAPPRARAPRAREPRWRCRPRSRARAADRCGRSRSRRSASHGPTNDRDADGRQVPPTPSPALDPRPPRLEGRWTDTCSTQRRARAVEQALYVHHHGGTPPRSAIRGTAGSAGHRAPRLPTPGRRRSERTLPIRVHRQRE